MTDQRDVDAAMKHVRDVATFADCIDREQAAALYAVCTELTKARQKLAEYLQSYKPCALHLPHVWEVDTCVVCEGHREYERAENLVHDLAETQAEAQRLRDVLGRIR